MQVGLRLKELRAEKRLSQGDIERATGLLRCYVSRVENGHTVPSVDTLQRWARALGLPLYRVFYEGNGRPVPPKVFKPDEGLWGASKNEAQELHRLRRFLAAMDNSKRKILMSMAGRLVSRDRLAK